MEGEGAIEVSEHRGDINTMMVYGMDWCANTFESDGGAQKQFG